MKTMMFSILLLLFISIQQVRTGSFLTGTYDPNSTALINERSNIKEIDVLRQIINQETLIRLAVVKDVKAIVDDVSSVKRSIASTETMIFSLQKALNTLKSQVDSLIRDNTLAQTVESLKRKVDILLSQDMILTQRIEKLERRVDTLSKDNALQHMVNTLKTQDNSLSGEQRRENKKIAMNCENRIQETEQKFNRNIADIYELLNNRTLLTVNKDLNINKDCKDLYINGNTKSGVYEINPFGIESKINVFCVMVTEGGGWTAIQRRLSGSVSFDRTWAEYRNGFGNLSDSYWLGNDVIHQLTKGRNASLYVSITLRNGTKLYELYNQFSVADETNNYRLFLGGPVTGTLGDRMLNTGSSNNDLSGMYFSTPDKDNDRASYNCAANSYRRGGWWFNYCHLAFLNGQWSPADWWYPWWPKVESGTNVRQTMMLIKRH
ncbi:fibrinogen-like protein A [Saccostrea echinata]|uniref:fibrinogen-like protein A n=1 Tax=Saccostrea echinata TaxID=191078 RepID=UPI002A82C679|nr:fibrinogen-like protein A [Saccostrea echinata]